MEGGYGRGEDLVEGEGTLILEDLGGAVEGAGVLGGGLESDFDDVCDAG